MAKKAAPKSSPAPKTLTARPATPVIAQAQQPVAESAVRKTVVPKPTPVAKKAPAPVTYERIAERAYHISQSGYGGSEHDNWLRAEHELKNETV